ncbi:hypothetical protein [Catellatospora sp. NPDC049133]|uniref:hypothetical protein n=1 Tax=Catellatospora sp. NPDC049133 TaxID=3155499 RepID=UPI0033DE8720
MGEVPEETVRELYTALPEEFTAARDAAAAAAKAAGHAAQATAIKRLRRPTVAAWLVNLLAHRAPERIAELTALSAALRDAQRQLRGADLRALTVQRRELLSALAERAVDLGVRAQPGLTPAKLPQAEVEQTLAAALADDEIAAQVRAGTVVKAVSYTGFGAASAFGGADTGDEDDADVVVLPRRPARKAPAGPAPTRPVPAHDGAAAPAGGRVARRAVAQRDRSADDVRPERETRATEPPRVPLELRRELASAREAEQRARDEADRARAAEAAGADELARLRETLAALEERRARAQQEVNGRRAARTAAERALAAAVRRTTKAQAAIDARSATA